MKLLNNKLNFAVQGRADISLPDIDIEAGVNAYSLTSEITLREKNCIRTAIADAIKESTFGKTTDTTKGGKTIKDLREKPVYYIKANKIILDKEDYNKKYFVRSKDSSR